MEVSEEFDEDDDGDEGDGQDEHEPVAEEQGAGHE